VSRAGQAPDGREDPGTAVFVADFPMPPGTRFDWHTHEDHQLAWAASGVLTVLTADATWVLPPTRALWIPAGLPHETASDGGRAVHARRGGAGQPGGRPCRLRHPERVRSRIPPRDRPDSRDPV